MISIITVNWNTYDFLELMVESLRRFSEVEHNLIVVDNSDNKRQVSWPKVHMVPSPANIGHGRGLNYGVTKALELFPRHPYVMFLDSDCHFLRFGWEEAFLNLMKRFDMVGGKGVPAKPIRPACMFMKKELAKYDWTDTAGYQGHRVTPTGFDVAIKAYYKIMAANHPIGFLQQLPNPYGTHRGEAWGTDDTPYVYHHWHGSHLTERQVDFPEVDLQADKDLLFSKIPWRVI